MFEESVVPYLAALTSQVICSQTVKVCGIGESRAETMVKDLIEGQTNPRRLPGGDRRRRITKREEAGGSGPLPGGWHEENSGNL